VVGHGVMASLRRGLRPLPGLFFQSDWSRSNTNIYIDIGQKPTNNYWSICLANVISANNQNNWNAVGCIFIIHVFCHL
jgi:hypothetical protein